MFSYNIYSLYTVVEYTLLYMQYHHEICIEKAVQRMKVWGNVFNSSSRYISNQLYVKDIHHYINNKYELTVKSSSITGRDIPC